MQRLFTLLILILLFFLSGAFAKAQDADETVALDPDSNVVVIGLGESVRIDVASGRKVHISDGGVVRSRVIGRSILMTGRRTGRSSLRIVGGTPTSGSSSGADKTIVVTERKVANTARLFNRYIENHRGLKFNYAALPALLVSGELLRLDDWKALVTIARDSKVPWRLEARIFSGIQNAFRKHIEDELTRAAWPGQRLSIDDKGPTLTGGADSAGLTTEQKLAVTTLGIQLETSAGLTELEPMVRTQIVIAEVRRNRARELGINWPNIAKATLLPSLQVPTEALVANINAMEQEGSGRILAMPTLLCRSGGEAKFLAGGEIPIKLTSLKHSQVEWKKYGITLHVQPKADRMKRMKFQLSTEVSTLDKANEVEGVPGMLVNRIETQFNLSGPQTIVLSGLIKREDGVSAQGLPILRSIPVLGNLFESENFRKNLTELLIFVSPEVVIPDGAHSMEGSHDGN